MAAVTLGVATESTALAEAYPTASFTPAAGDVLVLFATKSQSVNVGSVSDSTGSGWVFVASALFDTSTDLTLLFVRTVLASGAALTVTYLCTGDEATGCILQVARVSGLSRVGTAAIRQSSAQANQAAVTTPAPVFGGVCVTGNPTLALVGNGTRPAGVTIPTGWTDRDNGGYNAPDTGARLVSRDSGFTGTTITWGGTSATAFASLAVELDASGFNVAGIGATCGAALIVNPCPEPEEA